jgi:hypothetical protein
VIADRVVVLSAGPGTRPRQQYKGLFDLNVFV